MKKRLVAIFITVLVMAMTVSCFAFTGCGEEEENGPVVMVSADGKYDLCLNDLGRAWITEHGKEDKLVTGNFKIREENSALTLSFNDEVVTVTNYRLTYAFTYSDSEAGIAETSFSIHRGTLMQSLGQNGVVLDTAYDDPDNPDPTAGAGGMMGTSLLMSNIGSGSKEGYGKLEIKLMKIQGNWDYKYTKEEGLVVDPTDAQKALVGSGEVRYDAETETYYVSYDIANPPPFGSPSGEAALRKVDIEKALLLTE